MRALVVAVVAMMAPSAPAEACSIRAELRIEPTFVEKIEQSYAIVVVTVDVPRITAEERIPFVVREVYKGPLQIGAQLEIPGRVDARPCGGTAYLRDVPYVLFLTKAGLPRWSTSIAAADTSTRFAIAELVRIGTLPADARGAALAAARTVDRTTTVDGRALADLVDRHFTTPTPAKSFAALWPMLRTADRDAVIYSIGLGADPEAATFMTHLLRTFRTRRPLPREELHAIAAYFAAVHVPAAAADLQWLVASSRDWPWRSEILRAGARHVAEIHEQLHVR